nr:NADH dehydrogenase subunit 6 [Linognathus africanus]
MLIKLFEMTLTLLFFLIPSKLEVYSILLLAMMVIVVSIDLFINSGVTVLVITFVLGFLGGIVVLICFFVKVCGNSDYVGSKFKGVVLVSIMLSMTYWTFTLYDDKQFYLHYFPVNSDHLVGSDLVVKWPLNLSAFIFVMLILMLILFSVEALIGYQSIKGTDLSS